MANEYVEKSFDPHHHDTSLSRNDNLTTFFMKYQCHNSGDMHQGHHGTKLDMHKFDGIDLVGGVAQMEYFFFLHKIFQDVDKLQVGIPYLDVERW